MPAPKRPTDFQRARSRRRGGPLLLTLALLAVIASGCGSTDPSSSSAEPSDGPAIAIQQGTLTHHDPSGRLVWTMDVGKMSYKRGRDRSRARNVRVRFMDAAATGNRQTVALTVRADRLVVEHRTRNLRLQGDVRGEGPDSLTFETDRARWNAEQRRITGETGVRIQRDDLSMRGIGFSYDLQSESLTMQSASLEVQLEGGR